MKHIAALAGLALCIITSCAPPAQQPGPQHFATSAGATPVRAAMCHSINGRADRRCSPGLASHNPEVAADAPKYLHTLCQPEGAQPRWIAKRRPPTTYTNHLEAREFAAYGMTGDIKDTENDHIIPLSFDGDPGYAMGANDLPLNLYPQPWEGTTGAKVKDREERLLHSQVCSGALTLQQAQDKIVRDWTK
jgi:hypothetical protein